ncbi:polyprenyl synthetase family protein [Paenibacillus thermoaerophilus]
MQNGGAAAVGYDDGKLPFSEYMKERVALIESALAESIPAEWNVPERLKDAMYYSLLAGGKRLRPLLVLAAAEATGAAFVPKAALLAGCAIEMIHTYSLIHDDLPAMDNDDFRRGRPTNHKVYGEAMAILAGDGLLTHAFYTMSEAAAASGLDAPHALALVSELSAYAGARGMVGGQAADMLGEQGVTKLEELEYIHLHKTADLIVCSLRAGARIGRATETQLEALTLFGRSLGLAFQIQDDILDLTGDESKLGKPLHSDEKQQKVTYPYFIGLEASREKVGQLTQAAVDAVAGAGFAKPGRLLEFAQYLMNRDH